MPKTDTSRWLTTREAERHLGVSRAVLERLLREQRVRAYQDRPGANRRFLRPELDTYLESIATDGGGS